MSYSLSGSLALHLDDLMIIYAHTHILKQSVSVADNKAVIKS